MSAVKLPRALEEKLGDLAAQVRRLWLYRGISWFVLILLGSALGLVLLDARFELPGWGRLAGIATWSVLQLWAFRRFVVRPMRNEIPVPLLAAAIENQFPNLSERLSTLVELSENAEPGNGSKALIDVLARDTAQRSKKLNFTKAAPTGSVLRLVLIAFILAGLIVSPLFFFPGTTERLRRFLLPWVNLKADIGFKVQVSSKDLVMKRNDSVTLTGFLERLRPDAELPDLAVLIYKENGGDERKLPMTGDEKATFTVTRPSVKEPFEYCLEAGGQRSDWYKVAVVDAVELTEGTAFTINPPNYAKGLIEPVKQQGLQEFEALQYSKVKFELKFNRPARSATFEWKPAKESQIAAEQFFVNLTEDRTGGTVEWMLNGEGMLKLMIVGEQNVRTEIVIATKATLDAPPKFEKVLGVSEKPRDVRPGDRVPIELTVTDDIKVDKVELHFEKNGDPATRQTLPIALKEIAPSRLDGRYSFDLTDKAITGEVIRFRVRAVDNRNVPEFNCPPQEVFFPEKGWSELRLNPNAKPLAEQDILAKKERIKEKLEAVAKDVADALKNVEQVNKDAAGKDQLTPEQIAKLDNAKNKAKDAARELDELAREAGLTPDFRPLADEMRDIAEDALRQADERMRKAQNEAAAEPRDKAVNDAAKQLGRANNKLRDLIGRTDQFARNLLNKRKLEELADKEKELAEELKKNPDNERVAREVAKKQQELNAELDELLKQDPDLTNAMKQAAARQAKDLADETKQLNEKQKQLDQASKDQTDARKKQALEATKQKQQELNEKADELRKKTEQEAKVAGADAVPKQPFDKANEQLDKGNAVEAMTEQEKAAQELDRLARDLDKAAADRKDPRNAARQMAKLEEQLRKQAADAKNPNDELRKKQQQQQEAVKKAAEKLNVPKDNAEAQKAKDEAIEKLERARKAAGENTADADQAMKDAAEALNKLADKLPSREERLKKAKDELEKLQREQDALQREAAEQLKKAERKTPDEAARKELADKLADTAKKQQELADKVGELDTPGLEKRRDKAANAGKEAAEDLQQGRPQDIPGTQQQAKRQMEQLRQALDGQKPNDQKADELAKKQQEIADNAKKADGKPDPNQLQRMQELEREIKKELGNINDPNAAEQLNRAKDAVRKAEDALERKDADELKKKTKEAAEQLERLADQLADVENDADRAERLAKQQEAAAEKAQKQAGKPTTPEQTATAQDELERELDDLKQMRAGDAQEQKKKAADSLERLRKEPTPEKAPKLQKDAAQELRKLADELQKKRGEQQANQQPKPEERGNPDANNKGDDAGGQLPNEKDAQQARELAQQQREARNELAKANEKANQGEKPTDNKQIDDLAKQQQQVADEAKKAAQEAAKQAEQQGENQGEKQGEKQGGAAKEAAEQAQQAADQLKAGNAEKAQQAGEKAAEAMQKAAKENGPNAAGKKSQELAEKQKELNKQIGEKGNDAGAQAAQQQARQAELAKKAEELADKLDNAAKDPDNRDKVDQEKLKKAAENAREAQKQMDRAKREGQEGRKQNADDARAQAEKALDQAQKDAQEAGGEQPGEPKPGQKNAQQAGKDIKEAEGKMDEAGKKLGQKKNDDAQKAMEKAAEKLNDAAKQLAKGEGQGQGGESGGDGGDGPGKSGGKKPGGNDGSAQSDPTKTDVPKDLQQYLGKPWGELPGDVKSKIIQDLKAKYGEDYARVIKLYFEQLAEKK